MENLHTLESANALMFKILKQEYGLAVERLDTPALLWSMRLALRRSMANNQAWLV